MSSIRNVFIGGLIAILFTGCMMPRHRSVHRVQVDRSGPSGIHLTRTKGQRGKHFSTRVSWSNGTFIQTPKVILDNNSGTLPPGLRMDERGLITGTPSQSGFWSIVVRVSDRYKGTPNYTAAEGGAWPSNPIEIKIFDKLTDER